MKVDEWEVRDERTGRVVGRYLSASKPGRGDVIEVNHRRYEIHQVADLVGRDETQQGWLIVRPA